jgi:hypothetical protein
MPRAGTLALHGGILRGSLRVGWCKASVKCPALGILPCPRAVAGVPKEGGTACPAGGRGLGAGWASARGLCFRAAPLRGEVALLKRESCCGGRGSGVAEAEWRCPVICGRMGAGELVQKEACPALLGRFFSRAGETAFSLTDCFPFTQG